ncbi:MAG TPA: ATP-binding cassette domain-containing protein [Gemmatimonadaceae bacterium]
MLAAQLPPRSSSPTLAGAPAEVAFADVHKAYRAGVPGCCAVARVLRGIDLRVMPGEVVGIAGGPGSGKSTLLLCAAGLLRADSGRVSWGAGVPPGGAPGAAYVAAGMRLSSVASPVPPPSPPAPSSIALLREVTASRARAGVGAAAGECRALARVIAAATTLLVLDDASALLGGRAAGLVRSLADLGVAVLAAARDPRWLERAGARTLVLVHGALVHAPRLADATRRATRAARRAPLSAESARPRG